MKVVRFLSVALAVVALAVIANPSAAQNLFNNASFESELEYGDDTQPNWFAFFGAGSTGTFSTVDAGYTGTVMPSDGAHHLSIANDGTANGFSGVQQSVPVVAGIDYTFAFDAKSNSGTPFGMGAEFRIEWLDAGGNFVGGQFDNNQSIAGSLTTSYQPFSQTHTAPVGAVSGRGVIALETFSQSGTPANLFVDASSFTAIPEPGTLALAGLGVLAIFGGRRRS